jgi:hypothetical protein
LQVFGKILHKGIKAKMEKAINDGPKAALGKLDKVGCLDCRGIAVTLLHESWTMTTRQSQLHLLLLHGFRCPLPA